MKWTILIWLLVAYKAYGFWELRNRSQPLKDKRNEIISILDNDEYTLEEIEQLEQEYFDMQRKEVNAFNIEHINQEYYDQIELREQSL